MRITSIVGVNFKGRSFKTPLAPLSVLVGQNFTGKSSRTEALTLALATFIPGIEKLPGKIHERLASGPVMSVQTDFDGGQFVKREYTKAADGSVARNYTARGLVKGWAVDPVLIDANEFLGLSPDGRVKFLFQHLTMTGEVVTPATLFDKLGKTDIANSEEAVQLISALDESITADHEQAMVAGLSPQLWLERLVADIIAKKNESVKAQNLLSKAAQVENLNRPEMAALNPTVIKKALEDAKADLKAKQEALTAAKVARAGAQPALSEAEERGNVRMAENSLRLANESLASAKETLAGVQSLECCDKCGAKNKGWRAKIEKAAQAEVEAAEKVVAEATATVNKCGKALQSKLALIEQAKNQQFTELDNAVKTAHAQLTTSEFTFNEADGKHNQLLAQQSEESRRKKQARDAIVASTKAEVFKAFAEIAQESLDGMVQNSIAPFLDKVNELCGGILTAPIGYQGGELGMVKPGSVIVGGSPGVVEAHVAAGKPLETPSSFVGWRSFSGSEKLVFTTAVQIALAAEGALRVAVIDEVGRFDDTNRGRLAAALVDLLNADKLDNVILIEAGSKGYWDGFKAKYVEDKFPNLMAVVEVKE